MEICTEFDCPTQPVRVYIDGNQDGQGWQANACFTPAQIAIIKKMAMNRKTYQEIAEAVERATFEVYQFVTKHRLGWSEECRLAKWVDSKSDDKVAAEEHSHGMWSGDLAIAQAIERVERAKAKFTSACMAMKIDDTQDAMRKVASATEILEEVKRREAYSPAYPWSLVGKTVYMVNVRHNTPEMVKVTAFDVKTYRHRIAWTSSASEWVDMRTVYFDVVERVSFEPFRRVIEIGAPEAPNLGKSKLRDQLVSALRSGAWRVVVTSARGWQRFKSSPCGTIVVNADRLPVDAMFSPFHIIHQFAISEVVFDSLVIDKFPKWMYTIGIVKLTVQNCAGIEDSVSQWFSIGNEKW